MTAIEHLHQRRQQREEEESSLRPHQSVTCDYKQSLVSIASELHKAIRDSDNHGRIAELVSYYSPSLLWEKNSNGWTALHFASSLLLPVSLWKWILSAASKAPIAARHEAKNNVWMTQRTDMGQSFMELFFQTMVHPLPWQSQHVRHHSQRIQQSIQYIIANPILLQRLRKIITPKGTSLEQLEQMVERYDSHSHSLNNQNNQNNQNRENNNGNKHNETCSGLSESDQQHIMNVAAFWYRLELLLRLMYSGTLHGSDNTNAGKKYHYHCSSAMQHQDPYLCHRQRPKNRPLPPPSQKQQQQQQYYEHYPKKRQCTENNNSINRHPLPVLHLLAQTGCCPSIVGRLITMLYPEQAMISDEQNRLPLHVWVEKSDHPTTSVANNMTKDNNEDEGLLIPLLQTYPQAVFMKDNRGFFPLHIALLFSASKQWNVHIQPIFKTSPEILYEPVSLMRHGNSTGVAKNGDDNNKSNTMVLPGFALAAMRRDHDEQKKRAYIMARRSSTLQNGGLLWCYYSRKYKDEKIKECQSKLNCQHLSTIYQTLREYPHAIQALLSSHSATKECR